MARYEQMADAAVAMQEAKLALANERLMSGAAPDVRVTVRGLDEARRIMRDFSARLEKKVLRGALNKAATIGQKAAREEALKHTHRTPYWFSVADPETGKKKRIKAKISGPKPLYESIAKRSKTRSGLIRVSVGEISDLPHGWLVEHGHRMVVGGTVMRISGKQAGKTPKARSRERTGAGHVVGQVPPHPWISVAFDRTSAQMMSVFEAEVLARSRIEAASMAQSGGPAA